LKSAFLHYFFVQAYRKNAVVQWQTIMKNLVWMPLQEKRTLCVKFFRYHSVDKAQSCTQGDHSLVVLTRTVSTHICLSFNKHQKRLENIIFMTKEWCLFRSTGKIEELLSTHQT